MVERVFWFLFSLIKNKITQKADAKLQWVGKLFLAMFRNYLKLLPKNKRLLIIKPDGLGDFFICYKYLELICQSKKYKDYKVDLLTADYTIPFSDYLLSGVFDNTYKVQRGLFYNRFDLVHQWGLYSALFSLATILGFRRKKYSDVIYFTFLHEPYIEWIVSVINPDVKVFLSEKDVLPLVFNHETKNDFFEPTKILKATQKILPDIDISVGYPKELKSRNAVVVVALGASKASRIYSPVFYAEVLNHYAKRYDFDIKILVSESELYLYKQFISSYHEPNRVMMVDFNNVPQIIDSVSQSAVLLGNDSGMVHLAAVKSVPFICLASGNNIFRFTPYPTELAPKSVTIYPPDIMDKLKNDTEELFRDSQQFFDKDVNEIPVELVVKLSEPVFEWAFGVSA